MVADAKLQNLSEGKFYRDFESWYATSRPGRCGKKLDEGNRFHEDTVRAAYNAGFQVGSRGYGISHP